MKRRKKLWKVLAVLTVSVVVCSAVLFYRPVPYRFMAGARHEDTQLALEMPATAFRFFTMIGTFDSVVAQAKAELRPEDGWRTSVFSDGTVVDFFRGEESVRLEEGFGQWGTQPDWIIERQREFDGFSVVSITVTEKATPADRFVRWLRYR